MANEADAEPTSLGWQVSRFMADTLTPKEKSSLTTTAIWDAYGVWCAKQSAVPLAQGVFHRLFDGLAEEVGMGRRQNGANIEYLDVAMTP